MMNIFLLSTYDCHRRRLINTVEFYRMYSGEENQSLFNHGVCQQLSLLYY